MNALQLFLLGRRLTKLGEMAMRGESSTDLPASVVLIIQDVFVHEATSIGDIVGRTGLPQSYVSASIARLRAQDVMETMADRTDGRRTLVRVRPDFARGLAQRGTAPVDSFVADALGDPDPEAVAEVIAQLENLAQRLVTLDQRRPQDGALRQAVQGAVERLE